MDPERRPDPPATPRPTPATAELLPLAETELAAYAEWRSDRARDRP